MGPLEEVVERAVRERGAAVMAVLNVTPDSFSDGGRYLSPESACARVDELMKEGADLLDIGSESTRPGATAVSSAEQIRRAAPVIEYAVGRGAQVSIDTSSAEVADAALARGASLVNDVSCLADANLAAVTSRHGATLLIMHSRGSMVAESGNAMPDFSSFPEDAYDDIVADLVKEWAKAYETAQAEGVSRERIWFDPGLGFHKNASQSTEILKRLEEFAGIGRRLVIGASRKSFIGKLDGAEPEARLGGTIAANLRAVDAGATVLRVHDVRAMRQALLARRAFSPVSSALRPREAQCSTP